MALAMRLSFAACGAAKEWTRVGTFMDESGNFLNIIKSEDAEHPGWYVGCMIEEGMYGWYIKQDGKNLKGNIVADYMTDEKPFIVTVSEEGEDGVLLTLEDGKKYSFKPYELPTAKISVDISIKGEGEVAYAKGNEEVVFEEGRPYHSAHNGSADPEIYTIAARPAEGYKFWKWTKNGEDFSFEPQMTFEITENADYVAYFGKKGTDETHVDLANVKTLGEVLGLPEYGSAGANGKYTYTFEQDWIYYRATAAIDDSTFDALMDISYDDPDRDAKRRDILKDLTVEKIENISDKELSEEQLRALVGKTGKELTDAGWVLWGCKYDEMLFDLDYDCFSYEITFEGEAKRSDEIDPSIIADLVVKKVVCIGLGDTTGM